MTRPHIVHLVGDTTPGGVMRVLDHILTAPGMSAFARHSLQEVAGGTSLTRRIKADIIVSHLSINWRALPRLIVLRAVHPDIPVVHVEHSYTECFTALNVPNKARFHTLLRVAYALFDHVVAVSRAQGRWLTERGLVSDAALRVIPSCVDLSAFRGVPEPSAEIRIVGAIGRLHRQKGFDTLIKAFCALASRDMQLHVYGDGPERKNLECLAKGDPRIVFRGHCDDPASVMARVDAVAMPSRWEAYGLVALEARAAGRRILVSGADGLRDHIEAGAIGVQDSSVSKWTAALEGILHSPVQTLPADCAEVAEADFVMAWRSLVADLKHNSGSTRTVSTQTEAA